MASLDPRMRDELLAAGLANQRRHAFAEAERCYKLVLAGSPRDPVALYRMGVLALQCANGAGALHYLGAARAVAPLDADGCYHLGMAHALQYDFPSAQRAFEEALLHDPQHPSAAISLGNVHKALGRPAAAARAYLQAVASPRLASVLMSQVLVGLHTNPTVTPAVLFELHREWARRFASPLYPAAPAFANVRDPGRALRVGLLSPKLTGDIVGHFLRGVVPALAQRTELFLYHAGTEADAITGTCDALWMGVPVVTLAGAAMIARQGAALLTAAGLPQLVAEDADGFVAIARALAADPAHLEALRRGMRERLVRSPLCDGEAFAAAFMDVVREAWERWCAAPAVTAEGVGT